ncbi:VWFA-related Acidobacterial domain protein [Limihaloglobus sulfuriphilus]|uniref:VWFA-related Acidobacterial domain protein n=1 Tax=Limihaloglobus sulfuriphilus TaxID=1851148 RepID=A0A1Q2MI26_9BACT|nr:VWA domain-containing protein [Limihaloglobus sulfuriphilus]AQQ72178.1 VWFA-related Acidobacterial domain protein [Limihaloglobus sulfuriphilus]
MVNDKYLMLLFIVPAVILPVFAWAAWRRRRLLRRFAKAPMLAHLNAEINPARRALKAVLAVLAFVLIVVAMTRPRWNPTPRMIPQLGRDVVILLDVSRSMLAEDIKPNRLERAKIAIKDLIVRLEGDRVALVTFAGSASVKCPLTRDYSFLRMALDELGPESVFRGGTNVGDAIRKAANEVFENTPRDYRDIILITDGGDLEESLPVEAAEAAAAEGVRIIAVGLGDPVNGAPIPVVDENGRKRYLEHNGETVRTKLDSETLRKTALASAGGVYLPVETGTFDLGQMYYGIASGSGRRQLEEEVRMEYEEKFQIFLVLAFLVLAADTVISDARRRNLNNY